jgi:hypothetical protein
LVLSIFGDVGDFPMKGESPLIATGLNGMQAPDRPSYACRGARAYKLRVGSSFITACAPGDNLALITRQ